MSSTVNNVKYSSVPASVDLENSSKARKYAVNDDSSSGKLSISKLLCFFFVMAAILLAALSCLAVYFFVPPYYCSDGTDSAPEALTKAELQVPSLFTTSRPHKETSKGLRLPKNIKPLTYKLQMLPFLVDGNFTNDGFVSIVAKCVEPTDKITLNLVDITVEEASVRIKYIKNDYFLRVTDYKYDVANEMFTMTLDRKLIKDGDYKIDMKFTSNLNQLNQGFYVTSYKDLTSNQTKWLASTQFSPTDARRAFPCFDEPSYKATFSISLGRTQEMTSLSNMPRTSSEAIDDIPGYFWDHYQETPVMSTYLVAFIISDLQPYEFDTDGRKFTIWTRKEAISQAVYASTISPKILKYFERYFDVKYPMPKVDMVAVPEFGFSAMENWGLITFRESSLLLDSKAALLEDQRAAAMTMSHELAHQWFGNLVTPQWWNELWLKEGFATYFQYRGTNYVEPIWNITEEFFMSTMDEAMQIDALPSAKPIKTQLFGSHQVRENFNTISYDKSASVISMIQHIIGEETFREGLEQFLKRHSYGNAVSEDLWDAFLDKQPVVPGHIKNVPFKHLVNCWIEQSGFPVVTALTDYETNSVQLFQKRFFLDSRDYNDSKTSWYVPISAVSAANPDFHDIKPKIWLRPENTSVTLQIPVGHWYILNPKQTGYYLVNYDDANWKNLISNLMDFPIEVRGQLLSNAMDLARANLLDYDVPFKLLLTIGRKDNHLIPYNIAFFKLQYIYDMLSTTPIFNTFNNFLAAVFHSAFDSTGFIENPTDTYTIHRLRRLILQWSCKYSESRCVVQSRQLFRAWMIADKNIAPNLRDVVYCTAIREGGEAEFSFAYKKYLNSSSALEKETILQALGCASKPWLLSQYLNMMLDPEIKKQDGPTVFRSVAKNLLGFNIAFDFLRTNWKNLTLHYGVAFGRLGSMVESLTYHMNTHYQLIQLQLFKSENEVLTANDEFDNAIERVKSNINWMANSYKSIETWLNSQAERFGF